MEAKMILPEGHYDDTFPREQAKQFAELPREGQIVTMTTLKGRHLPFRVAKIEGRDQVHPRIHLEPAPAGVSG